MCGLKFLVKVYIPFGILRNPSDEPKTMDDDHDFVLLLKMDFEMLFIFLLESSHRIFR